MVRITLQQRPQEHQKLKVGQGVDARSKVGLSRFAPQKKPTFHLLSGVLERLLLAYLYFLEVLKKPPERNPHHSMRHELDIFETPVTGPPPTGNFKL